MIDTALVAIHGRLAKGTVNGRIAVADINGKQTIQFFEGRNIGRIKGIQPRVLYRPKTAFHFRLGSPISHRGVQLDNAERAANQTKLFISVGKPLSKYSLLQSPKRAMASFKTNWKLKALSS